MPDVAHTGRLTPQHLCKQSEFSKRQVPFLGLCLPPVPESSGLLSSGVDAGQAKMPSFDHAVGDPVEEDVNILQEHKIVFIEGNYVLLGTHHVCRANVPFQSVIVTFTLAQMHLLCRHRALE